jgi:hypothetical protein
MHKELLDCIYSNDVENFDKIINKIDENIIQETANLLAGNTISLSPFSECKYHTINVSHKYRSWHLVASISYMVHSTHPFEDHEKQKLYILNAQEVEFIDMIDFIDDIIEIIYFNEVVVSLDYINGDKYSPDIYVSVDPDLKVKFLKKIMKYRIFLPRNKLSEDTKINLYDEKDGMIEI